MRAFLASPTKHRQPKEYVLVSEHESYTISEIRGRFYPSYYASRDAQRATRSCADSDLQVYVQRADALTVPSSTYLSIELDQWVGSGHKEQLLEAMRCPTPLYRAGIHTTAKIESPLPKQEDRCVLDEPDARQDNVDGSVLQIPEWAQRHVKTLSDITNLGVIVTGATKSEH